MCSPRSYFKNEYDIKEYEKVISKMLKYRNDLNIFVHFQYVINLANPEHKK